MSDYIELGATPGEEECAQVGNLDYPEQSRKETRAYKNQLMRMFPIPEALQEDCVFKVKTQHGYDTTREVVIHYSAGNSASVEFAYNVERNLPGKWDAEARQELGLSQPGGILRQMVEKQQQERFAWRQAVNGHRCELCGDEATQEYTVDALATPINWHPLCSAHTTIFKQRGFVVHTHPGTMSNLCQAITYAIAHYRQDQKMYYVVPSDYAEGFYDVITELDLISSDHTARSIYWDSFGGRSNLTDPYGHEHKRVDEVLFSPAQVNHLVRVIADVIALKEQRSLQQRDDLTEGTDLYAHQDLQARQWREALLKISELLQ